MVLVAVSELDVSMREWIGGDGELLEPNDRDFGRCTWPSIVVDELAADSERRVVRVRPDVPIPALGSGPTTYFSYSSSSKIR